ncbi:MAG: hypothetical protein J4G13_16085 [Dehalococcoidia bacterium]|nr:hypothetical protein [Dehalococcoidia bacterium]
MFNILTEPLIRIATASSVYKASLSEVYAALMADEVEAFPALRSHQRQAWHAFLSQLAAMMMHRAGIIAPPTEAAEWAALIRGLTSEFPDDAPWHLVVDDITKPAFMQPPASSPDLEKDYKGVAATPDELDIISTSKNHDIKTGAFDDGSTDGWLFALINLQTMGGQIGQGHYPVSRMQSGWNSRTSFTLTSSLRWGGHISRDIDALLEVDVSDWPMRWDGIGLLWIEIWDGQKLEALPLNRLHPYYLEVCRRRRLLVGPGGIYAKQATSAGRRLATQESLGAVHDPWQLIDKRDKKGAKALALQKDGFAYDRIVGYLFDGGDWDLPVLFQGGSSDRFLVARGVKGDRGGQTEGYYERIIPLRPRTVQVFGRTRLRNELADVARERVAQVGKVKDALRHSIATFVADGDSTGIRSDQWTRASALSSKLDEIVDRDFFDDVQNEFDVDDNDARVLIRRRWLRNGKDGVIDHAQDILKDATDSLPCLSIHRYKAQVRAGSVFWGRLQGPNGLPELFDRENADQENNA